MYSNTSNWTDLRKKPWELFGCHTALLVLLQSVLGIVIQHLRRENLMQKFKDPLGKTFFWQYFWNLCYWTERVATWFDAVLHYPALMRPWLEYCTQVCGPQHRKDVELLKKVQKRAMKMIQRLECISCEDRLKELGLLSLEKKAAGIPCCGLATFWTEIKGNAFLRG